MKSGTETLLLCDCQRTMSIDADAISTALGRIGPLKVHSQLCRGEIAAFEQALATDARVHVACTQEAALFAETAAEAGADEGRIAFSNIRECAGWSGEAHGAAASGIAAREVTAKMAALLAVAAYRSQPVGTMTLKSEGVCLVHGSGQAALDVATELSSRLAVTLLLDDANDVVPPSSWNFPVFGGRIRGLAGHLGAFEVEVDAYAQLVPSSRAKLEFGLARDGARSRCDIVLDLSGRAPFLSEPTRRDGYIRADAASPVAVAKAMLAATDLVGEFEKPLYVAYDKDICAHSRNAITGCNRCVDNCPLGAIVPDGDGVTIDHAACGGCGACSAVCPTGAASYSYPARKDLIARAGILLATYRRAGGGAPVLLLHQDRHGSELISAMARFGRGLPANVLPVAITSATELGHDALAAMLALGAARIAVLVPPDKRDELAPLRTQVALTAAVLAGLGLDAARLHVIEDVDPDLVENALHGMARLAPAATATFAAQSGKREVARLAMSALHAAAPVPTDIITLPDGAPYGRIVVDVAGCTLCLSCVGACPVNALADNADRPELSFTEAACVQCGICVATCPEKVITLEPRYDFTDAALAPRMIKSEEPFDCIRCGKPFGARSSIERVMKRLEGHAMFQGSGQLAVIQMCDTCRIVAMAERTDDPMRGGARPRVVTTDDYLQADRTAAGAGGGNGNGQTAPRRPDDFIDD